MEEYLILQICHALIKLTVTRFVPSSLFYLFLINQCERLFQTVSYIFIDEHPQRVQYSQSRDRIKAISCLMLSQQQYPQLQERFSFLEYIAFAMYTPRKRRKHIKVPLGLFLYMLNILFIKLTLCCCHHGCIRSLIILAVVLVVIIDKMVLVSGNEQNVKKSGIGRSDFCTIMTACIDDKKKLMNVNLL